MGKVLQVQDRYCRLGAAVIRMTDKALGCLALGKHDGMEVILAVQEVSMACQAAIRHFFVFPDCSVAG